MDDLGVHLPQKHLPESRRPMAAEHNEVDIFIAGFTDNHLRRVPHQNSGFTRDLPLEAYLAGISNGCLDLFGLLINFLLVILS